MTIAIKNSLRPHPVVPMNTIDAVELQQPLAQPMSCVNQAQQQVPSHSTDKSRPGEGHGGAAHITGAGM